MLGRIFVIASLSVTIFYITSDAQVLPQQSNQQQLNKLQQSGLPQQSRPQTTAGQTVEQQMPSLEQIDLSGVNVDLLTDEQIRSIYIRSQQMGVMEEDLYTSLQARGMSPAEVNKFRLRVDRIKLGLTESAFEPVSGETAETTQDLDEVLKSIVQVEEEAGISELQKKIFGFSLFNNTSLTFQPSLNIPTPRNYIIGPGDEIVIDIWGASENLYRLAVNPQGAIRIPGLGPVYVSGLTIENATEKIEGRLASIYNGINPGSGRPNTFADISLGNVRSIRVSVVGEARRPGTYTLNSLSTIFNALYLCGGPSEKGSFREIQLIRQNQEIIKMDIYDFLVFGKSENNVSLDDQDIIKISPYLSRIEIQGEVKIEGIFEARVDETLADLIHFAGGFTENAFTDQVKVRRNTGTERMLLNIRNKDFSDEKLNTGDLVSVESVLNRYANRVQINGAIFRPGEYELKDSMTLLSLIRDAGGLRGDAYLERGNIIRTNEDLTTEFISFSIREVMKDPSKDIDLQREDFISVPSMFDLKEEYYVEIEGDVRKGGVFPFNENMTIGDLVQLAGGLRESASDSRVEVARRIKSSDDSPGDRIAQIMHFGIDRDLKVTGSQENLILQPFDIVFIRRSPGYQQQEIVSMEGEVLFPGNYVIEKKNERISELIKRSGGLTADAFPEGASLIRRTEYFNIISENEQKYGNILSLYNRHNKEYFENEEVNPTEADQLRNLRINDLMQNRNTYLREEGRQSQQLRRQNLREISTDIGLTTPSKQQEAIGIDLVTILNNPGGPEDLIMMDGDIISIPKELQTVRLRGEFLYPITVRYEGGKNFNKYVSLAGGLTDLAQKRKAYVIYANGSLDRTKNFLWINRYPKIEPGAEIFIPQKIERPQPNVQQVTGVATTLVTLMATLILLFNQTP